MALVSIDWTKANVAQICLTTVIAFIQFWFLLRAQINRFIFWHIRDIFIIWVWIWIRICILGLLVVEQFVKLLYLITLFEIIYCFFVHSAIEMNDSSIQENVILRKQIFHIVAPSTYTFSILLKFNISWVLFQICRKSWCTYLFVFAFGFLEYLLFVLIPKKCSYFFYLYSVYIWNKLLLHSWILGHICKVLCILSRSFIQNLS